MTMIGPYQATRELSQYNSRTEKSDFPIAIQPEISAPAEENIPNYCVFNVARGIISFIITLGAIASFRGISDPLVSYPVVSGLSLLAIGVITPTRQDKTCQAVIRTAAGVFAGVGSAIVANIGFLSYKIGAAIEFTGFLVGMGIIVYPRIAKKRVVSSQ